MERARWGKINAAQKFRTSLSWKKKSSTINRPRAQEMVERSRPAETQYLAIYTAENMHVYV